MPLLFTICGGGPPVRLFLAGGPALSVSMLGLAERLGVLTWSSTSSDDDSDDNGDSGCVSLMMNTRWMIVDCFGSSGAFTADD